MLNQILCKISLQKYGKNQFMIRVARSQCNRVSVEMQEMQEGRVVLLVKAENSQPTSSTATWPHWSGRTAWNRNANLLCWLRPSTLGPHFYVMEKGNLCPGSQITNETCLIIEKCFSSETKPFGASYTSHFLSLQGLPALQFAALLSNQDTEDISEGSCAPAADLQSQLAAPKEKYKAAHLLQDGIDLALLLLALESSPITCVWHQRNLFMPLVSLTGQRCQGNEKFGDFPIFRHVTGQTESKPWGTEFTGRTTGSLFPKHKLWPERNRNNQPVSAICYPAALTAQQSTNAYSYQWE